MPDQFVGKKPESMSFRVRLLEKSDIDFALSQTSREGWDTTRETFEVHLAHDPEGCFLASVGGEPAGMVTTTRYRKTGWVGELIVSPEHRRSGIGTALMKQALECLERNGARAIRLEGDPPGIPLYQRLGFVHEYESPRFRLERTPGIRRGDGRKVPPSQWAEVAALDERCFGDEREKLLSELLVRARAVYGSPSTGRLSGYLVVQRSSAGARLGPWVGNEPPIAEELLRTALSELESEAVVVALPGVNTSGQELLRRYGFSETPSSFRMIRGPDLGRGSPEQVYAIANGAFG
jgi:ribosomal protein S18 acetylase RimI-like enzyme